MFNDDDFNKQFNKQVKTAKSVMVVALLITLAIVGVVLWAIIKLVNHFL